MKISTVTPIYNGLNIRQIISRLPANMPKIHKIQYLNNCKEVYKNEQAKVNLGFNECIKNSNFFLINLYLNS